MVRIKKLVVSELSNTIFYATINPTNNTMSSKDRKDVTNDAVAAVFDWFNGNLKEDEKSYEVRYPSVPGLVLKMERE